MYKISKHKPKNKKKLLILSALVATLILAGAYMLYVRADKKSQTPTEAQVSDDTPANNQNASNQTGEGSEPKKAPKADDGTPLGNGSSGNSQASSNASVSITAQYFSESSSKAIVKAILEGAESGTCKVVFKKSGQPNITKSAPVEVVTSYYACGDLSVSRSKFPVAGQWSVSVQLIQEGAVRATSSAEAITIP